MYDHLGNQINWVKQIFILYVFRIDINYPIQGWQAGFPLALTFQYFKVYHHITDCNKDISIYLKDFIFVLLKLV